MTFKPLVSIIIPVYNGSNFLSQAIDSALSQTYDNIEIIVINDGSNDNGLTEQIALSYNDKIRYFFKENGGVASALNFGIKKMKGEFFSWLSHDDLYLPKKTELQINLLRAYDQEHLPIIYSDFDLIDSNGSFIRKIYTKCTNSMVIDLLHSLKVNGCTVLIGKKYLDIVGPFDENNSYWADSKMWFILAKKFNFIHVSDSLAKTRDHIARETYKVKKRSPFKGKYFSYVLDNITDEELRNSGKNDNLNNLWKFIALSLSRKGFRNASYKAWNRISSRNKLKSFLLLLRLTYYIERRIMLTYLKRFLNINKSF